MNDSSPVIEKPNDINQLQADIANSPVMLDFKRLYLVNRSLMDTVPETRHMHESMLHMYDMGMIDVKYDFWHATVKYQPLAPS
tara:strand:- start:57 stop:305 length:249 start_codon:yes stop_codon:yes gene_type:complete